MKLVVLGAGTFGTAIANALKNEHSIELYTRNTSVVNDINENRKNEQYFANKTLSKQIRATTDLQAAVTNADMIFLCLPSRLIVDSLFSVKSLIRANTLIVNGTKGFGKETTLITDALCEFLPNEIASFKGPSFANEMIFELPTAFTIATKNEQLFQQIQSVFRKELIVMDFDKDIRGVELLSIVKNVYAIAIGVLDATFNSANVRFMAFTKVYKEVSAMLDYWDISKDLLGRYAGIGDLGLTSLNDLSRNRTLGLLIGKGFWQGASAEQSGNSVLLEGINSLNKINLLVKDANNAEFPILRKLNALLNAQLSVRDFVNQFIYE